MLLVRVRGWTLILGTLGFYVTGLWIVAFMGGWLAITALLLSTLLLLGIGFVFLSVRRAPPPDGPHGVARPDQEAP